MEKGIKRVPLWFRVTVALFVVQLVVFGVLFAMMNHSVSSSSLESAVNTLQTAAKDRAEIIENYISSTEDTLTAYLKAREIYDLLGDPDNPPQSLPRRTIPSASVRTSETLRAFTPAPGTR